MNIPDLIFEDLISVFLGGVKNTSLMRIRIRDLVNPGSGIWERKKPDPG
jgi:hypothetical protein